MIMQAGSSLVPNPLSMNWFKSGSLGRGGVERERERVCVLIGNDKLVRELRDAGQASLMGL
jgi:hypothetical protein